MHVIDLDVKGEEKLNLSCLVSITCLFVRAKGMIFLGLQDAGTKQKKY